MKHKEKEKISLSIREAMNNLSIIADMDFEGKTPIGIVKNHRFVLQNEDFTYNTVDWLTEENAEDILENIKMTYQAILRYLKDIYEEKLTNWEDEHIKKGLQTIMAMAAEAAFKLDNYIGGIQGIEEYKEVSRCDEYEKIKEFYLTKISKKYEGGLEGEKIWESQWRNNKQSLNLDLEKRGLKDFETVLRDNEYELFYLKDDNEKPFFNLSLIRNIKLFCDFDESISVDIEDDPLMQIHYFFDKDMQCSAKQILHFIHPILVKYCKEKISLRRHDLARYLYKAVYALMLAANPNNQIENTIGKSSSQYFKDYLGFLRQALQSLDYQKMLAYPDDKATLRYKILVNLVQHLCFYTFLRKGGVKEEMIGFIHRLMRLGGEKKGKLPSKSLTFWQRILEEDENLRSLLKLYPNGPLFKDLDVLREEEKEDKCFEPILQGNVSSKLYDMQINKRNLAVLHLPCPTKQSLISKAHINPEFKGFLYANMKNDPVKKHLLINLQDKTSWKEYARCHLLEKMSKEAEFTSTLIVITLPVSTSFYYQNVEYYDLNQANEFKKLFLEQVKNYSEYGYYFPKTILSQKLFDFTKDVLEAIHKQVFSNKNMLSRKERLDFIELFYHLFLLKMIDHFSPDTMSFTCKDGVDTGAAYSASFYAFLQMLTTSKRKKEQEDMFLWLIYHSAFMIRERPIDVQRLHRVLSFLASFEDEISAHQKKILSSFSSFFSSNFLKKFKI